MSQSKYHEYIQLTKAIDRVYHEMALALGLPDSVMVLLYTLYEDGEERTPTELYAEWSLSKQTGHYALMWLKERGIIELLPSPRDRRRKRVKLTEEGRRFVKKSIGPLLAAEEAAFSALQSSEQEMLVTLLTQILNQFKEEIAGMEFSAKE